VPRPGFPHAHLREQPGCATYPPRSYAGVAVSGGQQTANWKNTNRASVHILGDQRKTGTTAMLASALCVAFHGANIRIAAVLG